MIDVNKFKYAESRWQDIFLHLSQDGFSVYPPAVKTGECTFNYIVLKNEGGSEHPKFSSDVELYSVMCYVPRDRYSQLEVFVQKVKKSMKCLAPMLIPTGVQTPSFYDDTYKAHMISIQYKNYKKM